MTSYENSRGNYIDFHRDIIKSLAGYAESLIGTNYKSTSVEITGIGPDGQIDESYLTDITAIDYEGIDSYIAFEEEDIARLRKDFHLILARMSILVLQAKATQRLITEQAQLGLLDQSKPPSLLTVRLAEKHTIFPDDELEVSIIKLHDVENLGVVGEYDFKLKDGPLEHCLIIDTVNDQIVDIQAKTIPLDDEDLKRWSMVLGPEKLGDLFLILAGRFENEDVLNNIINEFWQKLIGTPQEEIIAPLMDEIRIRSLAAKAANEMSIHFGTTLSLPNADMLVEWDKRLARL